MPFYDYVCESCGKQEEVFYHVRPSPLVPPACSCEAGPMERDWMREHGGAPAGSTYPFICTNFDGTPIEVRDAGHHRELCKQHGVRLRDDAAWLEDRTESQVVDVPREGPRVIEFMGKRVELSPTVKQRRQVKIEGNGRGLPGSWV